MAFFARKGKWYGVTVVLSLAAPVAALIAGAVWSLLE